MLLTLNQYKFKLECYKLRRLTVIPMATTKEIVIEYTQKGIRKEFKRFHYKNKLNTKEDSDDGNEGQKPKAYGKQIAK